MTIFLSACGTRFNLFYVRVRNTGSFNYGASNDLRIGEAKIFGFHCQLTNNFFPAENAPPLPPRPSRPEQATASPALPPRRPQRYFCVPFIRRSNQYRDSEFKKQGSW